MAYKNLVVVYTSKKFPVCLPVCSSVCLSVENFLQLLRAGLQDLHTGAGQHQTQAGLGGYAKLVSVGITGKFSLRWHWELWWIKKSLSLAWVVSNKNMITPFVQKRLAQSILSGRLASRYVRTKGPSTRRVVHRERCHHSFPLSSWLREIMVSRKKQYARSHVRCVCWLRLIVHK